MTIKGIIKMTLEYQELSRWAEEHPEYGLQRPFLEPVRAVLKRRKTTVQKRAAIKAYVGGDFWTQEKLWARGCSVLRGHKASFSSVR